MKKVKIKMLSEIIIIFVLIMTGCSKTYTINFDSDGGTVVQHVEVKKNDKIVKPANPTKEGYEFVEWQLDGQRYDFNLPVTKDMNLVAIWNQEIDKITISFETDGGNEIQDEKIELGKIPTKPVDPMKEGYEFVEWQLNGQKYEFDKELTEDITLKAIWKEKKYTVTFEPNNGRTVDKQIINEGEKVTKPTNPTKKGYIFVEWQLDGELFDFETTKITKDITLKAKWEKAQEYEVTFDSDNGSSVDKQTIYEGEKVTKPTNPTKNGYTFKEWQLDGKKYDFNLKVTKNITLKAVWIRKTAKYKIELEKVDQYSPDVKLIISDNNNNIITGNFVVKYLDGVKICSSKNLKTALSNIISETELIIEFSDGNIEYAKIK